MTLKEANKILEKEFVEIGFHKSTEPFEFDESRWFVGEKPEVLDAFRVLSKEGYYIAISKHDYDMRKARLGRPTDKPSSDTPSTLNPALKEAASQFNDALLDEQAKKIDEQNHELTRLTSLVEKKENSIRRLYYEKSVLEKENEELNKERSEHLAGEVKFFGETVDLSQELCDKNEKLRLSKIREKNLTEVCQKYMKEKEELKKELEEKTQLVEIVRNASKNYYDYGVSANEFIKKLANLYVIASNKGTISNEMFERCKNYQTYGFPATCNKETKKEINDIASGKENKKPRISTPEISHEELMKIQEKVVASCDIAEEGGDHSGAVVLCGKDFVKKIKENYNFFHDLFEKKNKKNAEFMFIESGHLGGNGILDQMENSNHPTEDNPEEVDMDEVLERVRKALEEGHTVSIDYKD